MGILDYTDEDISILGNKDLRLKKIITDIGPLEKKGSEDIFEAIIESIVSQQLSSRVAEIILERLKNNLSGITPENIAGKDAEEIKSAGLSMKKALYIKGVAEEVLSGRLDIYNLKNLTDQEIIRELVKLKGIGQWTAEMLMIFCLKRRNILSEKDLGINKGLQYLYYDTGYTFQGIREKFSPLCSLLSIYLWEISARGPEYVKKVTAQN